MNCQYEELIAAYVLGALEPAERDLVRAHIPLCAECRAAPAEIAPVPALLYRVSPEDAAAGPPVPDEAMLGRLLTAAAATRKVRRNRVLAAAAAALVLAAGGTAVALVMNDETTPTGRLTLTAQPGIHATLDVRPVGSGTEFGLELSGVASEEHCRLVVVADDGERSVAASWTATYDGTATFNGSTALPPNRIDRLVVETDQGRELASTSLG
jgi:hypothetical protein